MKKLESIREQVVYSMPCERNDDSVNGLIPLAETKTLFTGKSHGFQLKFNKKPNARLFSLEKDSCQFTMAVCGKEKPVERYRYPREAVGCNDIAGADVICQAYTNGVRGRMILRHRACNELRLQFHFKNLKIQSTEQNRIDFLNVQTGKVVFCFCVPYLEDGGGAVSGGVTYNVMPMDDFSVSMVIHWDTKWIRKQERVLPVSIHWQLNIPELTVISTYSKMGQDRIETTFHTIGGYAQEEHEMVLRAMIPHIKQDEVLERAVLRLTCSDVCSLDRNESTISLFQMNSLHSQDEGVLIERVPVWDPWSFEGQDIPTYSFDITNVLKGCYRDHAAEMFFTIKMERQSKGYETYVVLHGATANLLFAPKIIITYKKTKNKSLNDAFQKGDLVTLKKGSHYITGGCVPEWIRIQRWYIDNVLEDSVVVKCNEFGSIFELPPIVKEDIVLLNHWRTGLYGAWFG